MRWILNKGKRKDCMKYCAEIFGTKLFKRKLYAVKMNTETHAEV